MTTLTTVKIRQWRPTDSVAMLTEMLHRAYRPLAEAGMRFVASHQTEEVTVKRINSGTCFVAECDDSIIGTILYHPPGTSKDGGWHSKPFVGCFEQFAVEPSFQKQGIGNLLMGHVEKLAHADGAAEISMDTSERAAHLVAYYARRGYRFVEYVQWPGVNYRSVVMSKAL